MARLIVVLMAIGALEACGSSTDDGGDGSADAVDADGEGNASDAADTWDDGDVEADGDAVDDGDAEEPACPEGVTCVDSFVFHDERDTSIEGEAVLDGYSCAESIDESGREIVYRVSVPADGFLSTAVYCDGGVDVDVHILSSLDPASCLDRGNLDAWADVTAGYVWIVADTYVSGGVPQDGPFAIDIGFIEPSRGPCEMLVGEMARVGDGGDHLAMPAAGPIVLEAHLVTQEEPPPYPSTSTEELLEHYQLSQQATGLVMYRDQHWAPLEGGSFYGCGIGSPADFPVLHEGWYVNMYWTSAARPEKGDRMILKEPGGTRAVVVAAGYETGPGDLAHIAGTPEETHFYMDTSHLDSMQIGIATDQTLPFGPRVCE